MNRNSTSNEFLSFSKKEKLGILCFFAIVAGIYSIPFLFFSKENPASLHNDLSLLAAIDTLQRKKVHKRDMAFEDDGQNYYRPLQNSIFESGALFAFDPNNATVEDWKKLGLNERTIKTIFNYKTKGGKFYKKEDLQKIWGLPKGFYKKVENYISITKPAGTHEPTFASFKTEKKGPKIIDINTADTSAFIALPGIGSKLASRIVNFREKLGGFYSVQQIKEVYGIPDSTFQRIKPLLVSISGFNKMNINTASKDDLKTNPYFKWNLANAIVEYRNQHGPFKSLDDLKKIQLVDEETFIKISNYLTL